VARKRKLTKAKMRKAHRIARAIIREGGKAREPYAVGTAVALGTAKRRKKRKRK
jgi:hypothetical protein